MTRGWSVIVIAVAVALTVACGDDDDESTGTAGTGGGSTGGSGGAGATGGNGGSGGSGASGGSSGSATGGNAGAASDAAAGSGGGAGAPADGGNDAPPSDEWPDVLFSGVWMAGWSGGLDHYSWMKFTQSSPGQTNGQWAALDAVCTACTGYFACEGNDGLFIASNGTPPDTLTLQYPQACSGPTGEDWTILGFSPSPSFPPGALLQMNVQVGTSGSQIVQAFLYPASQCNAGFTSCTNPF